MNQSVSLIIYAVGDFWQQALFFTLASIKRQLYDRSRIQLIIISNQATFTKVRQLYRDWQLHHIPNETVSHRKHYYYTLALASATGELLVFLDADIIIPNYTLLHLDQITRQATNTLVVGYPRHIITTADLTAYQSDYWQQIGCEEYLLAGYAGQALRDLYEPLHPLNASGFLLATRRENVLAADFCQDYDGAWGEEDHDFALTMYQKGLAVFYHTKLPILHWRHQPQAKKTLRRQVDTLWRRHGNSVVVQKEILVAAGANKYPWWRTCTTFKPIYQPIWHYRGAAQNSLAIHVGSMVAAMEVVSELEGYPSPLFIHSMNDLSFQTHEKLVRRAQYRRPSAQPAINIYIEVNEQPNQTKLYRGYNIAYLHLEGVLVNASYLSYLEQYDELWVASSRQVRDLRAQGWGKPITPVQHGFFPEIMFPQHQRPVDSDFTFLSVGVGHRKGNYQLIDSFSATFSPREPVRLLIHAAHQSSLLKSQLRERYPKYEHRIRITESVLSNRQLSDLYNQADACISFSMGETWQLPLIEAAACGTPIITPRNNGVDYLTPDTSTVTTSREIIANAKFGYVEIDEAALRVALRSMVVDLSFQEEAKRKARRFVPYVHREYTWYAAARVAYRRLEEISAKL